MYDPVRRTFVECFGRGLEASDAALKARGSGRKIDAPCERIFRDCRDTHLERREQEPGIA